MRLLCLLLLLAVPVLAGEFSSRSEKLGPLSLGMTSAQVVKAVGKPASYGRWVTEAATGLQVQVWPYRGMELTMAREGPGGAVTLDRLRVEAPCSFATSRGVRVGDPESKVRQAYAGLVDAEASGPDGLVVGSVYDGILFRLEGGKVTGIFLGAAAE